MRTISDSNYDIAIFYYACICWQLGDYIPYKSPIITIYSLLDINYLHIMGTTALFLPAPCRPACNPAGALEFESSNKTHLVKNKSVYWASQKRQPQVLAAPASGSQLDSDVVWVTNSHLNVVARGRVPVVDILYPPS